MKDSSSEAGERIIVSCPDCQEKYAVTASRIPPQGGRLTCRICGGRIVLPGRRVALGAPVVAKAPDAPRDGAAAAGPAPLGSEVECPHCGTSFVPDAARAQVAEIAAVRATSPATAPAARRPLAAAPAVRPEDGAPRQKTILVAEDTEFFLELVKETLGSQYRMLGARTKTEALKLLGRESIDLVILDLSLEHPEDGLEVLAGAAPRGLPCLIFTARNEADLWGEGWVHLQAKGATDLLLKGMNIEEQLLSKVAALLGTN